VWDKESACDEGLNEKPGKRVQCASMDQQDEITNRTLAARSHICHSDFQAMLVMIHHSFHKSPFVNRLFIEALGGQITRKTKANADQLCTNSEL
jgi:hypothetical protein